MYIRALDLEDLKECGKLGAMFHAEKGVPGEFDSEVFAKKWEMFYDQNIGIVYGLFTDEDVLIGGIGGIVIQDIGSKLLSATEAFWFVEASHRSTSGRWSIRLVNRLRVWGYTHGATQFRMTRILMPGQTLDEEDSLHRTYVRLLKLKPYEVGYMGPIGVHDASYHSGGSGSDCGCD